MTNKLDQRLPLTRAELKERLRNTAALKPVFEAGEYDDFFEISHNANREVYGEIKKTDFDNISAMSAFFTPKQNLILEVIKEECHPRDTTPKSPQPKPLTKSQIQKRRKKKRKG